jgi:hypothetical protein
LDELFESTDFLRSKVESGDSDGELVTCTPFITAGVPDDIVTLEFTVNIAVPDPGVFDW